MPGAECDAGEDGRRAQFGAGEVSERIAHQLLARRDESSDAELVAQRTRRHEHPGRKPQQLRDLSLQRVDRRVLAVDVVPDFRFEHRRAALPAWAS